MRLHAKQLLLRLSAPTNHEPVEPTFLKLSFSRKVGRCTWSQPFQQLGAITFSRTFGDILIFTWY